MIAQAFALVLAYIAVASADGRVLQPMLVLYQGEARVIEAPNVDRIAIGKTDIVSATLLKNGEIVLTADAAGETNMQVWFSNGQKESVLINIVPTNGSREKVEIKYLLGDVPGIKITTLGRRMVIDGNLDARDLERVNKVKERYPDMLILAREKTEYEQQMVYFDVRVTEFDRDKTEELGINWSKSLAGPTLGYVAAWSQRGDALADFAGNSPNLGTFDDFKGNGGQEGFFWGVGSELTSIIDLLEQTGASITLSQPRLSTRSGGSASLTVGGEIPVVTSSLNGSSVEYKDYGIILAVTPKLDTYGNIVAKVSVSVSQLDLANAIEGQPAFKKRATENDVKLKPGETLVLSGLITREEQVTYNKLKWLGDIPI
ncbi:MAG: type II and III secretion system protein family protein, partial [Oceanococcus sp.]